MSTDHGITGTLPGGVQVIPAFLRVRPGDYVIVKVPQQVAQQEVGPIGWDRLSSVREELETPG